MNFIVPMWGSEIANSKADITSYKYTTRACDVTTIEREGDLTSLGIRCHCVW